VKAACLVCTDLPGVGSRAAAVNVEITSVVRPIVGDADFAEGGNKSEARSVLRGGALSISRRKWVAAESACPTHPLYRLQAKVPLRSSPAAEGCSRCARTQLSASSRHQPRSRCPHSCKQSSFLPLSPQLAAVPSRRRACLALPVPGCLLLALTSGRTAGEWEHAALSRRPDHQIRCDGGRAAAVQRGVCEQADVPVWH